MYETILPIANAKIWWVRELDLIGPVRMWLKALDNNIVYSKNSAEGRVWALAVEPDEFNAWVAENRLGAP